MIPALFLDRDGVIIENRDAYVRSWEDVTFIPDVLRALAKISQSPFPILIVTNQSAIGRGILTLAQAQDINRQILETIRLNDGRVDDIYICPHTPANHCDCRKPEPGLFLRAAADYSIDLSHSIMIGDTLNDLLAGQNAGLVNNALVLSGLGLSQLDLPLPPKLNSFLVFDALPVALDHFSSYIMQTNPPNSP